MKVDNRTEQLAALVLELQALREAKKASMKEHNEAITEQVERIESLARAIRSGQLRIEDGPEVEVVGMRAKG